MANGDPIKIGQMNSGTGSTLLSSSSSSNAFEGISTSSTGRGVYGFAKAGSGATFGVQGQSDSTSGVGVFGTASASSGTTYGAYGMSSSPDGAGVYAYNGAASGQALKCHGHAFPDKDSLYNCGDEGKRWKLVRAVTVKQGDLVFENSFTVTEDEKVGLAFKNDAGEKIAVLDQHGNFHIKGKFIEGLPS